MTSMLHEVQVSRLPLDSPSNHFRNFGVLNGSKFSPFVLLGQLSDSRSNESQKMFSNQHKINNGSIQYSQNNLQNSHSPLELFPSNSLQRINGHVLGKENKSILKKQQQTIKRRDNSPYSYNKERPKSVPCSPRKVDFRPCVIVFHFDSVEGNHVRSESQILTTEPKDRKKFLNRNHAATRSKFSTSLSLLPTSKSLDQSEASLHIIVPQYSSTPRPHEELPHLRRSPISYRTPAPVPFSQRMTIPLVNSDRPRSNSSVESLPRSSESSTLDTGVDFVFFEDESRRLWLRFVINLGFGVSASDVLVKANLAGNRVRIVGTRSCGAQKEEFHERCILPMEVDPHMITARMDGEGKLFVEGLIVTQEQKKMITLRRSLH